MFRFVFLFFVFNTVSVSGQGTASQLLHGKVSFEMTGLDGIYVVNLKTENTVITQDRGAFSIMAKVGDTLVFSGFQYKKIQVVLTDEDFGGSLFVVRMQPIMNQLNEVVIKRYDNINAVALGIIPGNQKSYTEAERKLYTATDLNASASAGGMAGGSVSADPLLNFLSGRTKMLKKELEVEKKEQYMKLLEKMFDRDYLVNRLKIPLAYLKGFEYYTVENDKFTKILVSNNKVTTEFLLGELALKYKEIIACENE
ncbi:hypothetical protein [Flavobacterium granuli]|uniref:CarboxypepD_reg-like domain-containing protein n=1 Tax=Flavobacterium granuli TaxID=280093 RepID=A0A1M5MXE9_9FLAO|nr:hypothetical protein [Flavobacterium granuli]PRZ25117.1 hypothetical protein BC624_103200 [Flavobacterium granuli]SHG81978.1 hypothetical protein SAMN05443373_104200 [Flavobacterium granuli]